MAEGPPVFLQRIADSTETLVNQRRAIMLDANFVLEDHPNDVLSGPAGGQVTGYTLLRFVGSSGGSPTFGSLTVGNYTLQPQPQVPTTSDASVNLLATALPIGTRQSVKVRLTMGCTLFGQTVAPTLEAVGEATISRLSGSPSITWRSAVTAESNVAAPFSGLLATNPLAVTGAADNGSGLIRLTVASTTGISAGASTVDVAAVGGVPNATGTWVVDAVPDSSHLDLRGSTWAGTYTSGGTVLVGGAVALVISGNTLQVMATGIKAAGWRQSESALLYSLRTSPSGLYLYTTAGTTLGSGSGPTGTGTGISDGTAVCEYLGASAQASLVWQATLETWTRQG